MRVRSTFLPLAISLILVVASPAARAQVVPQATVVEHFTSTRCSICFNRNPGFYANLQQQPAGTIQLAYHPSAPYRLCEFSQQNPVENDARTNFYGIYGSTPRLVLNGAVVPAVQNYADPALFAPGQGQNSPLSVQTTLTRQGADSLAVTVVIETVATPVPASLTLYVALAEDTVFYAAPNGETVHHDVFRKSFTGPTALPVALPPVGGSLTVRRVVVSNSLWSIPRLYAVAMVQQPDGILIQASASARLGTAPLGVALATGPAVLTVYPNPVRTTLQLAGVGGEWQILSSIGQVVACGTGSTDGTLDVRTLVPGAYVLRVAGRRAVRFNKE